MAKFLLHEEIGRLYQLNKEEVLMVNELKNLIYQDDLTPEKIQEIKGIIDELKDKIDEGVGLADTNVIRYGIRKSSNADDNSSENSDSPSKSDAAKSNGMLNFIKTGPISRGSKRIFNLTDRIEQ
jgi:hypothetical protein